MPIIDSRDLFGFGDEHGGAIPRAEICRRFVDFGGDPAYGGLAVVDDDTCTQIYVSGRGGGRTTYMRRAEVLQRSKLGDGVYVLQSDNHLPIGSDVVLRVADHFGDSGHGVNWQLLWRAATLTTLASHLLYNDDLGRPLAPDAVFPLHFREFLALGALEEPTSVYAQIVKMEQRFRGFLSRSLVDHLRDERWGQLERRLVRMLPACPLLALYIEGPDAELRHAPRAWLDCQKGLFYFAWHFPDNPELAEHVHVVATVRELAYAAVLEGDKAAAYGSRVRRLMWSVAAARRFLEDKVALLGEAELVRPGASDPMDAWLGKTEIFNRRLGITESLAEYLVTHTFLSPRELVHLGNALTGLVRAAKWSNDSKVDEGLIRETVGELAALFGRQRLVACATELVGRVGEEPFEKYSDLEFLGKRFARADGISIADVLIGVFADLGQLRFSREAFGDAVGRHLPMVGEELLDVLWHNRLIGYIRPGDSGEEEVFFGFKDRESYRFPASAEEIVIHRALIDTVELVIDETTSSRLRPVEWEEPAVVEQHPTPSSSEPCEPGADPTRIHQESDAERSAKGSGAKKRGPLVFVSHASEDKETVAEPLARALQARGWDAWVDKYELRVGDSLVTRIDAALAEARFGVLILSSAFFGKNWPRAEMDALVARELAENAEGMVLPVWHGVSRSDVAGYSPLLAGRLAVSTDGGIDAVADSLASAMESARSGSETESSGGALISGVPPAAGQGDGEPGHALELRLFEELKRLLPAVFEEIIFRLGVPPSHLSSGSQSARAIDLIRYVGRDRVVELQAAIRDSRS
ncbi:MAG: toll/interleukin-1 receptor domain-containing protein [Solirubrobacteraceae bacterium]